MKINRITVADPLERMLGGLTTVRRVWAARFCRIARTNGLPLFAGFGRFSSGASPFTSLSGLLSRVFHSLGPADCLRPISHLDNRCRAYQVEIEHLVAVGAEDDKVTNVIVAAITVDVSDFQYRRNPKSAMGANRIVAVKRQFALSDRLFSVCHRPAFPPA